VTRDGVSSLLGDFLEGFLKRLHSITEKMGGEGVKMW